MTTESEKITALEAEAIVRDEQIVLLLEEIDQLNQRSEHAAVIEQAKGVIMSTTHCSPDAAFAVLVAASQRENTKLFKIAERIAAAQDRSSPVNESGPPPNSPR